MIFADKAQNPYVFYDNGTSKPGKETDIEITEEAVNYYRENKERLNINLDNVPGDIITLDGIKQYGVDMEAVRRIKIDELKETLTETDYKIIKCSEYSLAGLPAPYDVAALHVQRQSIRDLINDVENGGVVALPD